MRYFLLATDYDGTLAHDGRVLPDTLAALHRLRATGRKLVMVTGRELGELLAIFPEIDLFEWVVAENGALLYEPSTREETLIAEPPSEAFVQALRKNNVVLSAGKSIVATWRPHEMIVLDTIRELGLELQVIFNKDAVMILPAGVNKATGLSAVLKRMGFSPHEVVGVGDAENDHAFLNLCEFSAAVSNALPALKERADLVTQGDRGNGVAELIDLMLKNDLADFDGRVGRRHLLIGTDEAKAEIRMPAYGRGILIAGPSGSGKSTATTSFLERLVEQHLQFCVIDPEGDYDSLDFAPALGTTKGAPSADEVLAMLSQPEQNAVVNLVGMRIADRPSFFLQLLPQLLQMRTRLGRPHWLIVDEAHHLLPAAWDPVAQVFPADINRIAYITVHPDQVHQSALNTVGTVIAVGGDPDGTIASFCKSRGNVCPTATKAQLRPGEILLWNADAGINPRQVVMTSPKTERRRHIRKYAEGELPPDRSFYFRGPAGNLNLRAQNLMLFLQLADGVDDATWSFHLQQADYSRWFRERIKDEDLAREAEEIEQKPNLSPQDGRSAMRAAVERRYTLSATAPTPIAGTDSMPEK
ncbi:MAG: HAD-IIB family hydrolase [Gemmataceae bacterium]|nr:HAD-IIB family hydrolase [Gemmataceae bacterium]